MKYILGFIGVLILFNFPIHAQDSDLFGRSNVVKISPYGFGKAEFEMSYERYFGQRTSSLLISPSIVLKDNSEETKEGYQVMGQYRFYLSHINRNNGNSFLGFHNMGLYAGVYGLYLDYTEDYKRGYHNPVNNEYQMRTFTKDVVSIEGGAVIGVQVDITARIVMDFFVGGGVRNTDLEDTFDDQDEIPSDYYEVYNVFDPEYKGVKPKIGFQVGITF